MERFQYYKMALTKNEKDYLKALVKRQLKHFKKEKDIAAEDAQIKFMAAEEQYEQFLENLLKKL